MAKDYEKLTLSNDFVFGKVMENKELCRRVLETLLQMEIEMLDYLHREKEIQQSSESKPIRLDIYVRDSKDALYDAEMQNKNGKSLESLALPKRSRYYQSLMDSESLKKGLDYRCLNDSYVVFICTFDPFGQGKYMYTFKNICEEDKDLSLGDQTTKIFFNTKSKEENIPEKIKNLFDYIQKGVVTDELTRDLDTVVKKLRYDEKWWGEYMKTIVHDMDVRYEGIEIGRLEGGIETLIRTCQEFNASKETTKDKLMQQFKLSAEAAEEELAKHWK